MTLRIQHIQHQFATFIRLCTLWCWQSMGWYNAICTQHFVVRWVILQLRQDHCTRGLNAKVGYSFEIRRKTIGEHGVGNINNNDNRFLRIYSERRLRVTFMLIQLKNENKTTLKHPWSKHLYLLNYGLNGRTDLQYAMIIPERCMEHSAVPIIASLVLPSVRAYVLLPVNRRTSAGGISALWSSQQFCPACANWSSQRRLLPKQTALKNRSEISQMPWRFGRLSAKR